MPLVPANRSALIAVMVVVGSVTAATLSYCRPLEDTFPIYRELAQDLRTGSVSSTFTPLGYPWFISLVPADSVDVAAKSLHVAGYVGLAAMIYVWLYRDRYSMFAIAAGSWILFSPYVLVNIYRLNDNNLTVVAMVGLFAIVRALARTTSPTWPLSAVAGLMVAVMTFIRPNAVTLLPVVACAAWLNGRAFPRRTVLSATVSAAAALLTYTTLSWVVTATPLFWPSNGPYNLFAGNNPASFRAIAVDYNAEPSLPEGVAWCGVAQSVASVRPAEFVSCTRKFALELPLQAMQVTAFKTYNLLWRPNLRLAGSAPEIAVQYAMLLPSVLWFLATAAILFRCRRVMDPVATAVVAAFVVPFMLTNSDPRFRLPLDPVFAMSLAAPASVAAIRELFGVSASARANEDS